MNIYHFTCSHCGKPTEAIFYTAKGSVVAMEIPEDCLRCKSPFDCVKLESDIENYHESTLPIHVKERQQ